MPVCKLKQGLYTYGILFNGRSGLRLSDQPDLKLSRSLIGAFASRLNILGVLSY